MPHRTLQRVAIRQVFEAAQRPLGPPEVLAAARMHVPSLGLTTVYRTLKALVAEGWLAVVELPGEPNRYECAGLSRHHYFRCDGCGRVTTVALLHADRLPPLPPGYTLREHALHLRGRCADCARAG